MVVRRRVVRERNPQRLRDEVVVRRRLVVPHRYVEVRDPDRDGGDEDGGSRGDEGGALAGDPVRERRRRTAHAPPPRAGYLDADAVDRPPEGEKGCGEGSEGDREHTQPPDDVVELGTADIRVAVDRERVDVLLQAVIRGERQHCEADRAEREQCDYDMPDAPRCDLRTPGGRANVWRGVFSGSMHSCRTLLRDSEPSAPR